MKTLIAAVVLSVALSAFAFWMLFDGDRSGEDPRPLGRSGVSGDDASLASPLGTVDEQTPSDTADLPEVATVAHDPERLSDAAAPVRRIFQSIHGRVRDARGPVEGASVRCFREDRTEAINPGELDKILSGPIAATDADGRFEIELEERAPSYQVLVRCDAHAPLSRAGVKADEDLEIVIADSIPIFGRVLTVEGQPVEKAEVRGYAWLGITALVVRDQTNSKGEFSMEELLPQPSAQLARVEVHAAGFAPLVLSPSPPLIDRGPRGQELTLVPTRGSRLRGQVIDDRSRAPISGAQVEMYLGDYWGFRLGSEDQDALRDVLGEWPTLTTSSDESGLYCFEHVPIDAFHKIAQDIPSELDAELSYVGAIVANAPHRIKNERLVRGLAEEQTQIVNFEMQEAASITGRVIDAAGSPVPEVILTISAERMWSFGRGRQEPQALRKPSRSGEDGTFRILDIPVSLDPRKITIDMNLLAQLRDESGHAPGLILSTFAIGEGEDLDLGNLVLDPNGLRRCCAIVKVFRDDAERPIWGAALVGSHSIYDAIYTDESGLAYLESPRPTLWNVHARGFASSFFDLSSPEQLPDYRNPPLIKVRLYEEEVLRGKVFAPNGSLPKCLEVSVITGFEGRISDRSSMEWHLDHDFKRSSNWAMVKSDGRFEVHGLCGGPYWAAATEPERIWRGLELALDASEEITIALQPLTNVPPERWMLEGVVVDDATGALIPKVEVRKIQSGPVEVLWQSEWYEPPRRLPSALARLVAPGEFLFESLHERTFDLAAQAVGFVPLRIHIEDVAELQSPTRLEIRLKQGQGLRGRLIGFETGMQKVDLRFTRVDGSGSLQAIVDDTGDYLVRDLGEGKYLVRLEAISRSEQGISLDRLYVIDFASSQYRSVDLTLARSGVLEIGVRDPQPWLNGELNRHEGFVEVLEESNQSLLRLSKPTAGTTRHRLPPGNYVVQWRIDSEDKLSTQNVAIQSGTTTSIRIAVPDPQETEK